MFLDPDPRPPKHSTMSGMSSPQSPTTTPRSDIRLGRRIPLNERTKSQNNQRRPSRSPEKTTVRLVKPSPAPESPNTRVYEDSSSPVNIQAYEVPQRNAPIFRIAHETSDLKAGLRGSDWGYRVSDSTTSTNEPQSSQLPAKGTTQPPPALQLAPFKSHWHRRSTSSGYVSESSTLKGSEFTFSQKSRKSERLSQGTTARGTPTPSELEFRGRPEEDDMPKLGPTSALQTLQEASPERPTIRAVTPSVASSRPGTGASGPSHLRYHSVPPESQPPSAAVSRSNSRRSWSTDSVIQLPQELPSSPVIRIPGPRPQRSEESINPSEASLPSASSPNFVAYSPESARPRSRSQPLRDVASFDSINSRLHSSQVGQRESQRRLVSSPSWSSQSSNDVVPTLQLPRKRTRHASAQSFRSSQASSSYASRGATSSDDGEFIYRRQGFQSQLSTIASLSEQQSRATSQHISQFSIGSGVTTIDDGDRTLPVEPWPVRRRHDVPVQSVVSEPNSNVGVESSSGEEPGDMTLGIFREESAKPPPLFTGDSTLGESTIVAAGTQQQYDGPSPLLPPVIREGEGDETFDTLSALQTVPLRQQRSGYSLRQRSNSTPSTGHSRQHSSASYVESDRWSYGSSIFPTWAKHYYGGTAVFSSKVSLSTTLIPVDRLVFHSRHSSTRTDQSMPSRMGTEYSNIESNSVASRPFFPRFFRPPGRLGFRTPGSGTSSRSRTNRWVHSSRQTSSNEPESRPDSMAILPDPLPSSQNIYTPQTLPSSPPVWESFHTQSSSPPPQSHLLSSPPTQHYDPQQPYQQQQEWDSTSYPRPMTKEGDDQDQDQDHEMITPHPSSPLPEPHLHPSRRNAQSRLSMWRAPSFVESLDTLIHSRCNRQILLFGLGFLCPLLWMLGAALPLPKRPMSSEELGESLAQIREEGGEAEAEGEEGVRAAMVKHEMDAAAMDSERRWTEERVFLKARWWRVLNRVMSVVGLLVIGAIIALAVVATA